MNILPATSASSHWLGTGLALVMGLAATCQAGMVVKADPPARQASPSGAPLPGTQRPSPAHASGKTAPPAADRSLPRPAGQTGQAERAGWPACIRQLNAAALSEQWDDELRQTLLAQCP